MNFVRLTLVCLLASAACLWGQGTKKIVTMGGDAALVRELESASPKARIVSATPDTVLSELADAEPIDEWEEEPEVPDEWTAHPGHPAYAPEWAARH